MLPPFLRCVGKELLLIQKDSNFIRTPLNYQTVRWRRKPRWLPVAKSKVFKVPERPQIPKEEKEELQRLFNNYRTEIKSLRKYFLESTKALETGTEIIAKNLKLEEEEYQKCLQINDEWNAKVASLRLARIAKEKEIELQNIIKEVEETKLREEVRKKELEVLVKLEKEKSKTFITPNNIDEAIEKALTSLVDHDFAIDIEGNKYTGRHTKPKPLELRKPLSPEIEANV